MVEQVAKALAETCREIQGGKMMHNMRRITRFEVYAVDNDVYLENGEVRITNPDIKVCLACDVGDLENKTEEMILHHKYKRCLAMARWCNDRYILDDCLYELGKTKFYERWEKRWLELAEKFKEVK
jgi:hypothetical protein